MIKAEWTNKDALDVVRRQDAIIQLSHNKKLGDDEWELAVNNDIQTIRQLPSAEPKQKTGRWIEISSLHHTYKCSECGRLLVNVTDGKNNVMKHYPYCHCGAKMEKVEHE